jgi:hypothetical protein
MKKNNYVKLFEQFTSELSTELDINKIMDSYLESAIWTEEERMQEDEVSEYGELGDDSEVRDMVTDAMDLNIHNFSDDSKIQAYTDIKKFLSLIGDTANIMTEEQLGHDLWLTRNGHGAGFWDRGYDEADVAILNKASEDLGEIDLYVDDSGVIRFGQE